MIENMFTQEYYEKEQQWCLDNYREYNKAGIKLTKQYVDHSIYSGYMYKRYQKGGFGDIYSLFIDGTLFMSTTPMEVESHVLPIQAANGVVGVGGLGMGYYIQRILDKEEVKEVIVYELNKAVIDMYTELFGTHPKLTIHNESALDIQGKTFDFFYMDIYEHMYNEEAVQHMEKVCKENDVHHYHYWTMEGHILDCISQGQYLQIHPYLKIAELYMDVGMALAVFTEGTTGVRQDIPYFDDESKELLHKLIG